MAQQFGDRFNRAVMAATPTVAAQTTVVGVTASKPLAGGETTYSVSTAVTETSAGLSFRWSTQMFEPGTAPGATLTVGWRNLGVSVDESGIALNVGVPSGPPSISVSQEMAEGTPSSSADANTPIAADATRVASPQRPALSATMQKMKAARP